MKIKISKSQWKEMGKKAGWDKVGITTYFDALRQNLNYILGKVESVTSGGVSKGEIDFEYLRSNVVSALEDLERLKKEVDVKIKM
jgi:hypothetical protein